MIIAGIGTAVPEFSIAQDDAATVAMALGHYDASRTDRLAKLYRLTRVQRRFSVLLKDNLGRFESQDLFRPVPDAASRGPVISERMGRYECHAPDLAEKAARRALDRASIAPAAITHLITVSCSGFSAPGADIALIKRLGLSPETQRTHVGFMGCHGALNGIRVARGLLQNAPDARVLLVAVEICSVHYQFSDEDDSNLANGLFSDGAAALVALPRESDRGADWHVAGSGACLLPDSESAMTWKVRDHGFQMTLGREVPALIQAHLRPWLESWLSRFNMAIEEVGTWAVHPGGPAILQAVQSTLGLRHEDLGASWEVLRAFGNMSSPTILFVLEQLRDAAAPCPCVALGFGPGLAVEATLIRQAEVRQTCGIT